MSLVTNEWDEYLSSEEYMDSLVDDEATEYDRAQLWFSRLHHVQFWDRRLA